MTCHILENLEQPGGVYREANLALCTRALASDPKLLLMDEPTEGIQCYGNKLKNITRLNRELKLTIVLVEQNVDLPEKLHLFCDDREWYAGVKMKNLLRNCLAVHDNIMKIYIKFSDLQWTFERPQT